MTTALIDTDIVVHRVGWATQEEDETTCIQTARQNIRHILRETQAHDFKCYLSKGYTFRHLIASNIYKGNRTKERPVHYDLIREFIEDEFEGIMVEGIEADDQISIDARQLNKYAPEEFGEKVIVCSIDKDLNQIPGRHYNFVKEEFYKVFPQDAEMNLWYQVLAGDTVDNIPGLPRVGIITAKKLLGECLTAPDIVNTTKKIYKQKMGYRWEETMMETGRLVYLLREEDDSWDKYLNTIIGN